MFLRRSLEGPLVRIESWPWFVVAVVGILIVLAVIVIGIVKMDPVNRKMIWDFSKIYGAAMAFVIVLILIGAGIDYGLAL